MMLHVVVSELQHGRWSATTTITFTHVDASSEEAIAGVYRRIEDILPNKIGLTISHMPQDENNPVRLVVVP